MKTQEIDLNNPNIMSATEAAKIWHKCRDYVRQMLYKYPDKAPKGSYRKFGKSIVVTTEFMEAITGMPDPR